MALDKGVILELLRKAFDGAEIELVDYAGDNDHYELKIKHKSFEGMSRLRQHKMVYSALGRYVGNELHAISIKSSAG
ncbi:MAG: DNA-binding global transcriptional regulator BolA, affects cell shape, cell division and biofilm formation [Candidatus Midichloria mitochondrii]|uniref:BolA-like protein n=1 Tax=Midichloria mitochondrii (strain IricVA) TaxID=696127 RepID=F7XUV1_MIDMI|nr:BolA/IbaG family iron-sulfur metabolism protein [Candidatus Midichloria mitochondrii]AEI88450.1 BolA-like protein [Candidatus Midichloria mitochondrii IricVA]MDJ1256206.1 BolA/IbaG family iron-sulfur metabolism protein [Candidatus Midichloria mitochondrii]MDJ1287880.1 BolA/IbaG family iron-sulfur metabolism protein [Candidatus Midichloria mitochondrii]MDJ1298768.1 BolA/IbaG family iron-sulfur metabolism protein [Candidatus Midichloria mitochondrii]MDJ1312922.1 BolA/IbaG family iron-sulfur m